MAQTDWRWQRTDELRSAVAQREDRDDVGIEAESRGREGQGQCVAVQTSSQPATRTLDLDVGSQGDGGSVKAAVALDGFDDFSLHSQRVAVARCQEARQQADRQVAGAAVEASDLRAFRGLSWVGPVMRDPIIAPRTSLDTCVAPSLLANVALAGVTARENDLHRHPESALVGALHLSAQRSPG